MAQIQESKMEMVQVQESNNKIPEIIDEFKITTDKIIITGVPSKEEIQTKAGLKIIAAQIQIMGVLVPKLLIITTEETIIIVGPKIIIMEITAANLKIQMEIVVGVLVVLCVHAKRLAPKLMLVLRVLVNLHVLKDANKFIKVYYPGYVCIKMGKEQQNIF